MHSVIEPIKSVKKLCAEQKIKPETNYRMTNHSLMVPYDNGQLLYHTLTGELLYISGSEKIDLYKNELIKKWFLVPSDFDENEYSDNIHKLAAILRTEKKQKDGFTIFTTTDCNARCFYCYEMGRDRISMTEKTAKDVANYIYESNNGQTVRLRWFGGEPLYNMEAIDIITTDLTKKSVTFTSSMTSNGYYLTPDVSRKAVSDWNMENIQITIDGTKEVYNRTKAYIDKCENAFGRVLDNIAGALDAGIKVFVRLNVDRNNASDIMDAVDILGNRFSRNSKCKIVVAILRSFVGEVATFEKDEAVKCYFDIIEKAKIYGIAREKELDRELCFNRCMADNDACEVILPDGRLGKCEHFSETELIGSIYKAERDQEMVDSWKERFNICEMPECSACALYPRCINLKKCEWTKSGCPEYIKEIRIKELEQQLLQEYDKYRMVDEK